MEECRTCGLKVSSGEIKIRLQSDIKGFTNFKAFIEYFCRIDVSDDPKLPQGCCKTCYNTMLKFCIFVVNVEKEQNKFINRLPIEVREEPLASVKEVQTSNGCDSQNAIVSLKEQNHSINKNNLNTNKASPESTIKNNETNSNNEKEIVSKSPDNKSSCSKSENSSCDANIDENSNGSVSSRGSISSGNSKRKLENDYNDGNTKKNPENGTQKPREIKKALKRKDKIKAEKTLDENLSLVQELFIDFKKEDKDYVRITIKKDLLNQETGEVPQDYLRRFNDFKSFQDFSYPCYNHCSKKVKSLRTLLDHYDQHELPLYKRGYKCGLCSQSYTKQTTNINLFLNHMAGHLPHLKFSCFYCDKVFVNVERLTNHLKAEHNARKLRFFPCFDCGLTFNNLTLLTTHKATHEEK